MATTIELAIYGTRGSCACGTTDYTEFGGDTSSYTLRHGNILHFLDAGSGVRRAMQEQLTPEIEKAYLHITHGHADHIDMGCGAGIYANKLPQGLQVIGYSETERALAKFFDNDTLWPVPLEGLKGLNPDIINLEGGETIFNKGYTIRTLRNYHPSKGFGGSIGFRFDIDKSKEEKVSVAYTTDFEFDFTPGAKVQEQAGELKKAYTEFVRNSDVLLVDTQFTKEEYFQTMPFVRGYGHPYLEQIIDIAAEANVKAVVGTHHAPQHHDELLRRIEKWGQEYGRAIGFTGEVEMGRNGRKIKL